MNTRKPSGQRTSMGPEGEPVKRVAKLGSDIKAQIGQKLRVLYGGVISQGVPDRFIETLKHLDEAEDNEAEDKEGATNG